MAGSSPDFDAEAFRTGIRYVYAMGAAPVEDERVTFHFSAQLVYIGDVDADDTPFDPASTVTRVEPAPLRVPCAIEYDDAQSQPTPFGFIAPTRVRITLLDEEYQRVKTAVYVTIAGDRYNFRRVEPPSGLFDVGLYTMHFVAESET